MKLATLFTTLLLLVSLTGCGNVEVAESPASAARLVTTVENCSGTPISNTPFFVTAAHCLKGEPQRVQYGDLRFEVLNYEKHPDFKQDSYSWDSAHDVAVLVVDGKFPSGRFSADYVGRGTSDLVTVDGWKWSNGSVSAQSCVESRDQVVEKNGYRSLPRCGITEGGSGAGLLSGESDGHRTLEGVLAAVDQANLANTFAPPEKIIEVLDLVEPTVR